MVKKIQDHFDYFLIPAPVWIPERQWMRNMCGAKITIDGMKITKTGGDFDDWNAGALYSTPNPPSYKVRIISRGPSGGCMIGLAPKSTFQPNGENFNWRGFYIYVSNGGLFSQQGDRNRAYGSAIANGSMIEVLYATASKQISFVVDGKNLGVAFTIIRPMTEPLYPAVDLRARGSCLEYII